MSKTRGFDRRDWLRMIAGVAAGAGVVPAMLGAPSAVRAQTAAAGGSPNATAAPEGTTLILLGTQAGPGVGLTRGQTASVVVVGGRPYLVDCGYGTVREIVQAGLRVADICNVFV